MLFRSVQISDGEARKKISNVERILDAFVRSRADRKSVVIAMGGGVIGDMAGFAASIYMRGIPVVQVPTTLMAQVDAAIGGKTGVNLSSGKNLAGTFHQPRTVIVDSKVLATLPEREYRAGLFEVIKCGAIRDPKLFEFMATHRKQILRRDPAALERMIADSVKIKAKIVAADERESDLRRILNFGHTVGHALEAASDYKRFLHGEAVGWGMMAAASIGTVAGTTPALVAQKIYAMVASYGPLPVVKVSDRKVMSLLKSDKKTVAGLNSFVLLKDIGKPVIANDVPASAVRYGIHFVHCASQRVRNG